LSSMGATLTNTLNLINVFLASANGLCFDIKYWVQFNSGRLF
jgi:hypothetical protein